MIQNFLNKRVNLWLALLLIFLVAVLDGAIFYYFREVVYNYNLSVPNSDGSKTFLNFGEWPALANADFFKKVESGFIKEKINFIKADLSAMELSIYENGKLINEFNILTKGKEGSWWETPVGLYKVEAKIKNHFSSFGKVYQPWSLQFQGNFFIHGWPYYSDDSPVASTYSGGCIRLATEDAVKIYDFAKAGMPILVFEKDFSDNDGFYYDKKVSSVTAKSYLAADLKNNFVLAEKSSSEVLPIASITKLLTALVSVEYINLDKEITISEDMLSSTTIPRLKTGEQISAYKLLYPLLQESSNEAAAALSSYLGRIRFVELMNKKAESLGMNKTQFTDASGQADGNVSTAQDIFSLAKYLYNNRSFVLKMSSGKIKDSIYGAPLYSNSKNFNGFINEPEFVGGKVGKSTAAGETMVSIFEASFGGENRPVVIVVLGAENSIDDTQKLLNFIKLNYDGISAQN